MDENERKEVIRKHFSEMGKKGGTKNLTKGKEYFSEMGKKGALKRWGNNVK